MGSDNRGEWETASAGLSHLHGTTFLTAVELGRSLSCNADAGSVADWLQVENALMDLFRIPVQDRAQLSGKFHWWPRLQASDEIWAWLVLLSGRAVDYAADRTLDAVNAMIAIGHDIQFAKCVDHALRLYIGRPESGEYLGQLDGWLESYERIAGGASLANFALRSWRVGTLPGLLADKNISEDMEGRTRTVASWISAKVDVP